MVAQVRGLHGLQGAVRVEVLTDRPEARFVEGAVLHAEGDTRPLTVIAAQPVEDGPGWRLRFAEVPTRNAAERLREAYLEVEVDRETDLDPGAVYWHEIVGATVRGTSGAVLGTVADVYRAGENEVYVVRGGTAGDFDVPAVRDVIAEFAPERAEIVVDEGVLDLAAAPVDAPAPTRVPRRRPRWSRHGKGGAPRDPGGGPGDPGGGPGDPGDAPRDPGGEPG